MRYLNSTVVLAAMLICAGCATYVTPGGAAPLEQLNRVKLADGSSRQPAPQLPASIAVVRVQASPYKSYSSEGAGSGRFSAVVARDVLASDQLQLIAKWPSIENAVLLNGAWLPQKFESIDDLRGVAAKMQADVLLVYTIDTRFKVKDQPIRPDSPIALGEKAAGPVTIESTASAILVDVRTGYLYGHADAEASADVSDLLRAREALDAKRLEVEQQAQAQLLPRAGKAWADVAQQFQ